MKHTREGLLQKFHQMIARGNPSSAAERAQVCRQNAKKLAVSI
jgi:hypothetical protein